MYILIASYARPPAEVEPHIPAHGAWIRQHMDSGAILAAGPKKSGLGGALLVRAMPRAELDALLAQDSYVQSGVADYQITDLDWKLTSANLTALKG